MRYFPSRVLLVVACLVVSAGVACSAPLRVLMVDGQNNHNWRQTTPVMARILEETGRFKVDVATSPEPGKDMSGFAPAFADYPVVLLNYNGDNWPEPTREAFVEYVRGGGGLVIVHAADNAFGQWQAYNEMIGLGGWGGRSKQSGPYVHWTDDGIRYDRESDGPGGSHEAGVRPIVVTTRAPDHPIMRGLPPQWHHADELYNRMRGPALEMTVLATALSDGPANKGGTGRHEPVLLTVHYGDGRVFHSMLGHDGPCMERPGFAVTLARGTEWAATGAVTLPVPDDFPKVLDPDEALGAYGPMAPARVLPEGLRFLAENGDEATLIAMLGKPGGTLEGRQALCDALGVMGSRAAVPVLSRMLGESDEAANAALLALGRIPGPEATEALIATVESGMSPMSAKAAIIGVLGKRRDAAAVPLLARLARSSDGGRTPSVAIRALGRIGTLESLAALDALPLQDGRQVVAARLDCAFQLVEDGRPDPADPVFRSMARDEQLGASTRFAALSGLLQTSPDVAMEHVWAMLADPSEVPTAIGLLSRIPASRSLVTALCERLEALPEDTRVQLLGVLGGMAHSGALPAVRRIAASDADERVRLAAVRSLGRIPADRDTVALLASLATAGKGPMSRAAHGALVSTPGAKAEKALLRGLKRGDSALRGAYAEVSGDRGLTAATPALLKLAAGSDDNARIEAFRALRRTAGPEAYADLIRLAVRSRPEEVRREAVRTVVYVGRSVAPVSDRLAPIAQVIADEDAATKAAFLAALPDIGGPEALAVAEREASAADAGVRDAAVRTAAKWQSSDALSTILALAEGTDDRVHRVLLLRAFGRLVTDLPDDQLDSAFAQCRAALDLGLEPEAKRLLLTTFAGLIDVRALELIEEIGRDPALAEDAKAAAVQLKQHLVGKPVLTASHRPGRANAAMDGKPKTRWDTGTFMVPGMWFMADLRIPVEVSSLTLDATESSGDYPRGYEVYVGNDPDDLGKPVASGAGDGPVTTISLDPPRTGRYVKIVQTGVKEDLYWSIHELSLVYDPGFPKVPAPVSSLSDLLADSAFVTHWQLAGPYTKPGRKGDALLDLALAPEFGDNMAYWRPLEDSYVVNGVVMLENVQKGDDRVAYLRCAIKADADTKILLKIGSDDGVKIWLNGALVHRNDAPRPVKADEDVVEVQLGEGTNRLLMKVTQIGGHWGACLRFGKIPATAAK